MPNTKNPPKLADQLKGLFAERAAQAAEYERVANRAQLPVPVRAKIGATESRLRRLRDVSVSGLQIDWTDPTEPGQPVIVRFDGYSGVCDPFIIHGHVVRVVTGDSPAVGIEIDRRQTPSAVREEYRKLILHYLRHRPLLDELYRGFFEGRCEACGWLGRVGERSSTCARCGQHVVPVAEEPSPPATDPV